MKPTHPIFFRSSCPWKRSHLAKYGAIHKIMDSLNMYFLKQTHSTHNWNIKLEWIVILFHKTTLYHAFTQHQGTEWRRKYFNILSSSSSESFWRSWPSPDSWVKFSILSLPFLYFCCLALMRSILYNKTPAATPRTHPQLPTHLCTQPTPTVTYTLMHTAYTHSYLHTYAHSLHPQLPTHLCTQPTPTVTYTLLCRQPKSWIVWQHLGLVDGCLLATTVSLFLLFSQVLHSSLKKKCCLPHIVVKIKWKDI